MIPVVVTWSQYTTTVNGQVLKLVPCENCQNEYIYVLEREAKGFENTVYFLSVDGDAANASEKADQALQDYLANDFDPVPCPVCGHYQRFMFPKLLETRSPWMPLATMVLLAVGGLFAAGAVFSLIGYLDQPGDRALWRMAVAWAVLAAIGLAGLGLWAIERARVRRFDPNEEDEQLRIEKGRSRARTRVEFETSQKQGDS